MLKVIAIFYALAAAFLLYFTLVMADLHPGTNLVALLTLSFAATGTAAVVFGVRAFTKQVAR